MSANLHLAWQTLSVSTVVPITWLDDTVQIRQRRCCGGLHCLAQGAVPVR